MSIWQIIVEKISYALTTVLIVIGIVQPITSQAPAPAPEVEMAPAVSLPTSTPVQEQKNVVVKTQKVNTTTTQISIEIPEPTEMATGLVEPIQAEPIQVIIQPAPVVEPIAPIPQPIESMPEQKTYTLSVISPLGGKGLGREYLSRAEIFDEANYIELGLIIYDNEGNTIKTSNVVITATDASQNKEMNSTGNVTKIFVEGGQKTVNYYPFHYEFKSPGVHTITFAAEGLQSEVTLDVAEDTRE